jgi:hypothetical protein
VLNAEFTNASESCQIDARGAILTFSKDVGSSRKYDVLAFLDQQWKRTGHNQRSCIGIVQTIACRLQWNPGEVSSVGSRIRVCHDTAAFSKIVQSQIGGPEYATKRRHFKCSNTAAKGTSLVSGNRHQSLLADVIQVAQPF